MFFFGRDAVPPSLGGSVNAKDGKFEISFSGEPNVHYRIDVSEDLKTWSQVTIVDDPTGHIQITELVDAQKQKRFYRALQLE